MREISYKSGVTALPQSLSDRVPLELLEDEEEDETLTAVGRVTISPEQRRARQKIATDQFRRDRSARSVKDQPRDYRGRFRDVLARLKVDLGESELNEVVSKVEDAENAEQRNDYGKAADAATDVVQMVDRLEEGALDPDQLNNIKSTTRELGKAIAFLPMPQGDPNATLRYSDLPPTTQQLLDNMVKRIEEKLTPEKATELLEVLNQFASGQVQLTSDALQSELAKLLTYLID